MTNPNYGHFADELNTLMRQRETLRCKWLCVLWRVSPVSLVMTALANDMALFMWDDEELISINCNLHVDTLPWGTTWH